MSRAIPLTLALALTATLALAACQSPSGSAGPPPGAAVTPRATGTPAASPSPSVAMTAGFKVSDVQEAEKVYREFYCGTDRIAQHRRGASTLPIRLRELLRPPARIQRGGDTQVPA